MSILHFKIHSSVNGHLGCFRLFTIVDKVAMNIGKINSILK